MTLTVKVFEHKFLKRKTESENYEELPQQAPLSQLCNKLNLDTLVKLKTLCSKQTAGGQIVRTYYEIKKIVPEVGKSISNTALTVYVKRVDRLKIAR